MSDSLNQLRRELAGRYAVEQELGHGGMAIVYLATDLRHHRKVAIKVLRQDVGGASAERFLREIRTVAALHHPHILQLLDSGTAGDHLFYVMPYVEGETIRQRLERDGPLPVDEAVRIAREVADALAFAHARGVVHRDIKPENIFLSAGHALVADFGIARAAESVVGANTLTDVGLAVGTPSYMSPEQATAAPKLDGRSDQYALGCVLYEMLAGAPPFTGPTSQAIMARHMADPVPPLRTVRDVPPALESAIARSLAKMPADRWPTLIGFAAALEHSSTKTATALPVSAKRSRLVAVVAGAVTLLAGLGWIATAQWRESRAPAGSEMRTVLLLPFTLGGDSSQRLLADYLTEQISVGLYGVRGLWLKSLLPSQATYAHAEEPDEVGRQRGADAVIHGSVMFNGNSVRVFPRLVDVKTGRTIWQRQFDGELAVGDQTGDAFSIIDEITVQIVAALLPSIEPAQRAAAMRGVRTRNDQALRLYVRARAIPYAPADSGNLKIELLRQAVALDSTFADGWVALADAVDYAKSLQGVPPVDAAPEIRKYYERAIALDGQHSGAFSLKARVEWFFDYDWDSALRDSRRAAELAPGSADAATQLFWILLFSSQTDSAMALGRRLVRADSLSALPWGLLSVAYRGAGLVDSSIYAGQRAEAIDSLHDFLWDGLVYSYLDVGRMDDAERIVRRLNRPENLYFLTVEARYRDRLGDTARVRELHDEVMARSRRQNVMPTVIATAKLLAGDKAGALRALAEASRIRDRALPVDFPLYYARLRGEPLIDSVRARVYGRIPVPKELAERIQ
jgi:TolB-like protein